MELCSQDADEVLLEDDDMNAGIPVGDNNCEATKLAEANSTGAGSSKPLA